MSLSLFRGFQAKPTKSGGFDELTSISLGYNRNIRKFTLGLGASYSYNDAKTEGSRATDRPDAEYVNLNSSLSMPLFAGRASGSIFVSYSGQIGGETDGDGDSTQAGFSIGWGF
jgi:outer membrane usher protein FimD/PapC